MCSMRKQVLLLPITVRFKTQIFAAPQVTSSEFLMSLEPPVLPGAIYILVTRHGMILFNLVVCFCLFGIVWCLTSLLIMKSTETNSCQKVTHH